ncbi:Replication protein A 70 kDa DNA-binding subunit B [Arachis hypogaea]|nr:Replication protein A 70 kDa DNA-binding subunit B [Arachis hypogaea]
MNDRVDLVDKITPWRESWKVHVKVVKLWYHKNPALDSSQNLLHMVLMDEKLHKIQATIRDQLISKFALSLNEGIVYLMTHFTVVPNTGLNRVTKHRFRLLFQYNTSVVSVVCPRIPHSGLCFASLDEIDQMTKHHSFLIDFVGIITGVRKERDVASYGKLVKAVVLEVFADGKRVQCNVFGNACDLLEYDKLQKYARSPLVVLESFKIKAIEGGVILQNVIDVSRLFINPDIPEAVEFLSRFSVASYGFSSLVTNDLGYLVSKVDGDYFNSKEISNIQDLHSDNGDSHYFVIGTIKEVMDEPDWWYYTCVCGQAVVEHEDLYLCDACGSCVENVMVKFCLKVVVSHSNGNNIFVLKDREVIQIIKTTCSSFLDNHPELSQGSYCKVVPLKLISSLLHKKVVFMVDARPVGYEMNRSVYIVQQIWDDASVINVFEAAAEMNDHKIHVLVDSMPEVEDAFSQCGSDHEAVEDLHAF